MIRKHTVLLIAGLAAGSMLAACKTGGQQSAKPVDLKDERQAFSYAIGVDIGGSLEQFKDQVDLEALIQGLKDTLVTGTSKMTAEEAEQVKMAQFKKIQEVQVQKNMEEAKSFFEENGKKAGVVTTASGLQYTVLSEGGGEIPTATDMVEVHYAGTLLDGKEFDSSIKRGQPVKFGVSSVIPGWTEVLQLMKVGSKYKVFVPSELGYGERGAGRAVGPNASLVFEIELLGIVKQ